MTSLAEATNRAPDADLARQVGGKLAHEFAGVFSPETIEQFAFESYAVYSSLGRDAHTAVATSRSSSTFVVDPWKLCRAALLDPPTGLPPASGTDRRASDSRGY